MIQKQGLHFVVDIDISGFFDNVNHHKLKSQMWNMGIRDKKLICIISEMLKAPILMPNGKKIFPTKGTPQGGILSPLLSNIVLNELDWWIASQWEFMPTHYPYQLCKNINGSESRGPIFSALRKSQLKEMTEDDGHSDWWVQDLLDVSEEEYQYIFNYLPLSKDTE